MHSSIMFLLLVAGISMLAGVLVTYWIVGDLINQLSQLRQEVSMLRLELQRRAALMKRS